MLWIFVIVHLFIRTVYTFNCFILVNAIILVILIPGETKYWKMGLYCKIKKPPKLGLYACQIQVAGFQNERDVRHPPVYFC